MGLGKKKDNGDDEVAKGLQNMQRKPGETPEELIRRLGRNVSDRSECPTCKGEGTEEIPRNKKVKGEIITVLNTETCRTCRGTGKVRGRIR